MGGRTSAGRSACGGQAPPAVTVPVGFDVPRRDLGFPPRSWVEAVYPGLAYFQQVQAGGRPAAWEEPQLFSGSSLPVSVGWAGWWGGGGTRCACRLPHPRQERSPRMSWSIPLLRGARHRDQGPRHLCPHSRLGRLLLGRRDGCGAAGRALRRGRDPAPLRLRHASRAGHAFRRSSTGSRSRTSPSSRSAGWPGCGCRTTPGGSSRSPSPGRRSTSRLPPS